MKFVFSPNVIRERGRESVFHNFKLLRCYVGTIQFLAVFYYEIERQTTLVSHEYSIMLC